MRLVFRALILVTSFLAIGLVHQIATSLAIERSIRFAVEPPALEDLKQRHGTERNLTHKETRKLYHTLLDEAVGGWIAKAKGSGASTQEVAVGCVRARWRARLYARSRDRDGAPMSDVVLSVRDAFQHAVTKHSIVALWDLPACIVSHPNWPCPSYAALKARKPDDAAIVKSCTKSNDFFDHIAGTSPYSPAGDAGADL